MSAHVPISPLPIARIELSGIEAGSGNGGSFDMLCYANGAVIVTGKGDPADLRRIVKANESAALSPESLCKSGLMEGSGIKRRDVQEALRQRERHSKLNRIVVFGM